MCINRYKQTKLNIITNNDINDGPMGTESHRACRNIRYGEKNPQSMLYAERRTQDGVTTDPFVCQRLSGAGRRFALRERAALVS